MIKEEWLIFINQCFIKVGFALTPSSKNLLVISDSTSNSELLLDYESLYFLIVSFFYTSINYKPGV